MSDLRIHRLPMGSMGVNTYVLHREGNAQAVVIDPAGEGIAAYLEEHGLKLELILLTHGHFDHIMGLNALREATGAPVAIHALDADMLTDADKNASGRYYAVVCEAAEVLLEGEAPIEAAGMSIAYIHTPGHTPGGVCYMAENNIFSGDTLFYGTIGRTDFPGSSPADMAASLKRLYNLTGEYNVYPGHGESSTLAFERKHNPFMKGRAI